MRYHNYQLLDNCRSFNIIYSKTCLNIFYFFLLPFNHPDTRIISQNQKVVQNQKTKWHWNDIAEYVSHILKKEKKKAYLFYTLTDSCNLSLTKYKWEEVWKLPCKMLKSSASEKEEKLQDVIHCRVCCVKSLKEHVSQYAAHLTDELWPGWNLLLIDIFFFLIWQHCLNKCAISLY